MRRRKTVILTAMQTFGRKSKITIPPHAHPVCRFAFEEMRRQAIPYLEMEYQSGVLVSTIKAWRRANAPGISTIEAVLGALGWRLAPVPEAKALPPELRADLEAIASKHALETLPCLQMIAACTDTSEFSEHIDARQRRLAA